MARQHDFAESLAWGERDADDPFWESVYRKAFPDFLGFAKNEDLDKQRRGIDRGLVLRHGVVLVEEKKRAKDWGDMLLEVVSNDRTGTLGWAEKDLAIDWLAYAFLESGRCYLFPWPAFRQAWLRLGIEWKEAAKAATRQWGRQEGIRRTGFGVLQAANDTYTTWSIVVPMHTVMAAVPGARLIEVR